MSYKEYGRLTRSRVRRGTFLTVIAAPRSSLWLGKDHLLKIDSMRFTEEYKRFYFRDIQAITVCKTRRREIWNRVLVVSIVVWLGTMLYSGLLTNDPSPAFIAITFSILAVPLLANNVLGPTCAVYLRTAVQIEELPSLSRVRHAQATLDRLRPRIIAAQGRLEPEELSMRLRELAESAEAS